MPTVAIGKLNWMKVVQNYVLLTRHGGRYRFTHLPFGIKTAGYIFIEEMNKIFEGIKGVNVITDDILIYGKTKEEHNQVLELVLQR